MADDPQTRKAGGLLPHQGVVDALRLLTEATRLGPAAGLESARRAMQGAALQAGGMSRRVMDAATAPAEAGRRMGEGMDMLAAGGMQHASQAWTDWLQQAMRANMHFSQAMLAARSLPEVARAHVEFIQGQIAGFWEAGERMMQAADRLAAERSATGGAERSKGHETARGGAPATVTEVMTRDVRCAEPDSTVKDAAHLMAQTDAGALPVGSDGRVLGMLTDRDIAVRVVAAGRDPAKTKVRQVMTEEVEFCREGDSLDAVVGRMAEQRLRRLPVLGDGDRLVGIVSVGDLATAQPDPSVAGRALSGIAQEGGPHQQRLVARAASAASGRKTTRSKPASSKRQPARRPTQPRKQRGR